MLKRMNWCRNRRSFNALVLLGALGLQSTLFAAFEAHAQMNWCLHETGTPASSSFGGPLALGATQTLTTLPAGRTRVRIELDSPALMDLRLETGTGTVLVSNPGGLLAGAGAATVNHAGMNIRWTGHAGIDGRDGHELIEVDTTTTPLVVKVRARAAGSFEVVAQLVLPPAPCPNPQSLPVSLESQDNPPIGAIPAGTIDAWIETDSNVDIDLQLIDLVNDVEVVQWPDGILSGPTLQSTTYQGVTIQYTGYDGVGGQLGDERIEISGTLSGPLAVFLFAYEAVDATVHYGGTPTPEPFWYDFDWCWNGAGPCPAANHLAAIALNSESVVLGTIPAGTVDPSIETGSLNDVDLQLIDLSDDTVIVGWPNGLLNGPTVGSVVYKGFVIQYSGYNGVAGELGDEFIEISGTVTSDLQVRAFGYQDTGVDVVYAPEPAAALLLGAGCLMLMGLNARRAKRTA